MVIAFSLFAGLVTGFSGAWGSLSHGQLHPALLGTLAVAFVAGRWIHHALLTRHFGRGDLI